MSYLVANLISGNLNKMFNESDKPIWQPAAALVEMQKLNCNAKFFLGNWANKYINVRMDMRTGTVLLRNGDGKYLVWEAEETSTTTDNF